LQGLKHDVQPQYLAKDLKKPGFIVGYGLDYDEKGRNLKVIYRKVD
jgi:hypoxanthine-guanine phosphoribosyltransferase